MKNSKDGVVGVGKAGSSTIILNSFIASVRSQTISRQVSRRLLLIQDNLYGSSTFLPLRLSRIIYRDNTSRCYIFRCIRNARFFREIYFPTTFLYSSVLLIFSKWRYPPVSRWYVNFLLLILRSVTIVYIGAASNRSRSLKEFYSFSFSSFRPFSFTTSARFLFHYDSVSSPCSRPCPFVAAVSPCIAKRRGWKVTRED